MNTNDNCGMATFKWLTTILSFAIALPGYFDGKSKIAFILTACVIVFGKLIENIEGVTKYKTVFHTIFCVVGSVLSVIAIGLCFYYFAAISNVTQIVQVDPAYDVIRTEEIEENQDNKDSVQLISDADMGKYPFFEGESFYALLFFVLIYFIIQETVFCGCEYCKYIYTKKRVLSSISKSDKILDLSEK